MPSPLPPPLQYFHLTGHLKGLYSLLKSLGVQGLGLARPCDLVIGYFNCRIENHEFHSMPNQILFSTFFIGERGDTGYRGLAGPPGFQGDSGYSGEKGLPGLPGEHKSQLYKCF